MAAFQVHLTDILLYAESLPMPEGDYLRVADALQSIFNSKQEESNNDQDHENWVIFHFQPSYFEMTFHEVRGSLRGKPFERIHFYFQNIRMNTNHRGEQPHFKISFCIYYVYKEKEEPSIWKGWEWDSLQHTHDILCTIYRPQSVQLRLDKSTFEFQNTEHNTQYKGLMSIAMNHAKEYFWSNFYKMMNPS